MAKPLGKLGVYLALALNDPILKLARDAASRRFGRNRYDIAALEKLSGIYAPDIHVLMSVAASGWLLICRCPNEFSYAYAEAIRSGDARPKPAGVYTKTNAYGVLGSYISDYDMMCAWRVGGEAAALTPVCTDWDGHQPLHPDQPGDALIRRLNDRLLYKLQHGFNDCWLNGAGQPRNRFIGDEFVAFLPSHADYILSQQELRAFYHARGMPWLYG